MVSTSDLSPLVITFVFLLPPIKSFYGHHLRLYIPPFKSFCRERESMDHQRGHVVLLPYPSQGHINPMLQFGKQLARHGLHVTLATTRSILATTPAEPEPGAVSISPISDGFDDGGFYQAGSVPVYLDRLASVGSETLVALIESNRAEGRPVAVLVYDAFLPWGLDVGKKLRITCAAFFTQSCAVDAIYYHVTEGRLTVPAESAVELTGLPRLDPGDLPSFLTEPADGPYPAYLAMVLGQFRNLEQADVVLINSFYELEPMELDWLKQTFSAMTIGPTVPTSILIDQFSSYEHYGFDLYALDAKSCMAWLNSKPPSSVVYISFGSMAVLDEEHMEEIAKGLENCGKNFVWVVRASEAEKLPVDFLNSTSGRGLVVSWSPQLEVLGHGSIGCFVTHCGWNSVTEGLCFAVPMIGVPQWTDQPTNAKYVEDVWRVGVRAKVDEKGIVRREEMERCIKEVMEGGRREEMMRNARKWRELAKAALGEGGSSNNNIVEFIDKYCS